VCEEECVVGIMSAVAIAVADHQEDMLGDMPIDRVDVNNNNGMITGQHNHQYRYHNNQPQQQQHAMVVADDVYVDEITQALRVDIQTRFDALYEQCTPAPDVPYSVFACRLFNQRVDGVDATQLEHGYMSVMEQAITLYRLSVSNHMVGTHDVVALENDKRFRRLIEGIRHAYLHLDSEYRGIEVMTKQGDRYIPPHVSMFRVSTIDVEENEPHQNLLLFLLNEAFDKGYRRYKKGVYEQIYTDDEHGHLPTHAWTMVCSVEEFVYSSVKKEVNYKQWQNLTHRSGTAKNIIEYLSKSKSDQEFPWLTPDRTVTAWRNGLYLAESKQFLTYDRVQDEVDSNVVACKFFDYDFYTQDTPAGRDGWYQLPTPVFESIMDYQKMTEEAKKLMYVMIGRLRYPMAVYDRWQVVPFLKGMAGTGKSTIGKYCLEMFEFADMGILSSNIEDKFGLYALMDKFAWVCLEVKERFGLPQSEFQSMISGEHMNIPVKHDTAISTVWNSPGLMCGNEMANWVDAAGSMTRRLFIWEFYELVREADPTLEPRLKQELGVFIRKVNEAYREYAERYGGIDIWNIPECTYFRLTRERAKSIINPINSFIQTSEVVRINSDGGFMPFSRFRELFIQWAKNMGRSTKFEKDYWLPVFSDYRFDVRVDTKMVKGRPLNAWFVFGIEEINNRGSND